MFTLKKFIDYINAGLNYPAVTEQDIYLFLDQAISEINTELHLDIPDLDTMKEEQSVLPTYTYLIEISASDLNNTFPVYSLEEDAISDGTPIYYYNSTKDDFGVYDNNTSKYVYYNRLYGFIKASNPLNNSYFEARVLLNAGNTARWYDITYDSFFSVDLNRYFTNDWIKLFLVPYVCHKYSVRDGDTGRLFSEEFSQGFQQLRNTYNIPSYVNLNKVAGEPAYTTIVSKNLPNLNVMCRTRAITKDMINPQGVNAIYLDYYDDRGGFNI